MSRKLEMLIDRLERVVDRVEEKPKRASEKSRFIPAPMPFTGFGAAVCLRLCDSSGVIDEVRVGGTSGTTSLRFNRFPTSHWWVLVVNWMGIAKQIEHDDDHQLVGLGSGGPTDVLRLTWRVSDD